MTVKKKRESKATRAKSIAEVATRVGVDERTVKGWLASGCPGEPGAYDVDAIVAWRAAHKKKAPAPAEGERAKYAARYELAHAAREELKLLREQGDLILVTRAAQIVRQHVAEVVAHLEQLPDFAVAGQRLPADAKKKIRERVKAKVREMRLALERSLREMARTARCDGAAQHDE